MEIKVYLFALPRFEYRGEVVHIPRRKAIALVAYLALARQPLSRETLTALLWSDLDHDKARDALRSTMHSLTKLFSEDFFISSRDSILLNKNRVWVDVSAFLARVAQHQVHAGEPLCDEGADLLTQALHCY